MLTQGSVCETGHVYSLADSIAVFRCIWLCILHPAKSQVCVLYITCTFPLGFFVLCFKEAACLVVSISYIRTEQDGMKDYIIE